MTRLHHLDYLRGLAALGIMLFHYTSWSLGENDAGSLLGRVGIYGVAIFYAMSGLTLFHAYEAHLDSWKAVKKFFVRRAFRIMPLLWISIFATLVLYDRREDLGWMTLLLNFSGLFSVLDWAGNITIGAWSIGNELAFYLFFPLIVFLSRNSRIGLVGFSAIILGIFLYFAFVVLKDTVSLEAQWTDYVNPLNQAFLFLGGFLMGKYFQPVKFGSPLIALSLILGGISLFIFYPAEGNSIHLVTGPARIVFTVSCLMVCLGAYKLTWEFPKLLDVPLSRLGEASYSVYLLHPMMYRLTTLVYFEIHHYPLSIQFGASVVLSLLGGHLIYRYVEKYFIRLGKRLV